MHLLFYKKKNLIKLEKVKKMSFFFPCFNRFITSYNRLHLIFLHLSQQINKKKLKIIFFIKFCNLKIFKKLLWAKVQSDQSKTIMYDPKF